MHYVLPTSNPDANHYYIDIFSDQINSLEKLWEKEILHLYDTLQSFIGLWVLPDSSKQKAIHVAELYNTESENTCNV